MNASLKGLFGLGEASAQLVEASQRKRDCRGFRLEFGGFLHVRFGLVPLLRAGLNHTQTQVGVGALGIQLQHFVQSGNSRALILRSAVVVVGESEINIGIVGLLLHQQIELFLGVGVLMPEDHQFRLFQARVIVVGIKRDGSRKLLVRILPLPELELGQRQLIVSVRKTRVQMQRVLKLDGSFPVLFFFVIALAAFQILLFGFLGIRTSRQ